jgi:hypothetical protein
MIDINSMIEDARMELIHDINDSVHNLLSSLNRKKSYYDLDIDCYGVGAMMPQEITDEVTLNNTELYGV